MLVRVVAVLHAYMYMLVVLIGQEGERHPGAWTDTVPVSGEREAHSRIPVRLCGLHRTGQWCSPRSVSVSVSQSACLSVSQRISQSVHLTVSYFNQCISQSVRHLLCVRLTISIDAVQRLTRMSQHIMRFVFNILALVNNEDQSLSFLMQAPVEAMCAVELSDREYLLVFASLGVYVDNRGRRTRTQEIMWPSIPNAVSKYYP